ncbi:20418_t:CDS:2 [Gigaspora margarita]|uniref:20418_t:CDS:1 n=1 Tax=Gigaspora margarita TaxID=4874 RepID=A0ABN7V9I3_GIGMA|nr:20418_t:CDS:2 [Gigaspora margarita]
MKTVIDNYSQLETNSETTNKNQQEEQDNFEILTEQDKETL